MKIPKANFHFPSIPHLNSKCKVRDFPTPRLPFPTPKLSQSNILTEDISPTSETTASTSYQSSNLLPNFSSFITKLIKKYCPLENLEI